MSIFLAFLSLLVERLAGYPDALFRAIGHPIVWIGTATSLLDRHWNDARTSAGSRRIAGVCALAVLILISGGVAFFVQWILGWGAIGLAVAVIMPSSLLANKSLD